MIGKTLSNEIAKEAVEARQRQKPYRILDSALGAVGSGPEWDSARANKAAEELGGLKDELARKKVKLDVNSFDRHACVILHRELNLPPDLVAHDGFWRWLAVEKFGHVVEARGPLNDDGFTRLRNYGIDHSVTDNRVAILWFRANMVYDPAASDPYHLAKRPAHTDFWESGIIRHRYAWSPSLARALVAFQYRNPSLTKAFLHSTHENGIRELYKRLRRLHSTISFEFLNEEDMAAILEQRTSDLRRA